MTDTIVIATGNAHKVDELQALFARHGIDARLIPMTAVVGPIDIEETGTTFEENAFIKARIVHERTGLPVIADDSGLEVDALHGAPGVYSARFSGPDATDASNRALLLERMKDVTDDMRQARFRCVLCYIDGYRTLFSEGTSTGGIVDAERGSEGFGYDSLFMADGQTRTYAEMSPEEKQSMSHRGKAAAQLCDRLSRLDTARPLHDDTPEASVDYDHLIRASIAATINDGDLLRRVVTDVVTPGEADELYEVLLQSYLFAGFPAALDSLTILADHVRTALPDHHVPPAEPFSVDAFRERGEVLCRKVYGNVYDRMMQRLDTITPDLRSWMIVEGYGKTLSRPGPSIVMRELCVVAMLAALGRTTQLYSHVRGALLVGATDTDMQRCVDVVIEECGDTAAGMLRTVWHQVSERM